MDFVVPRTQRAKLAEPRRWHGIIAIEGRKTVDDRYVELAGLSETRLTFPIPLIEDDLVVGTVDRILSKKFDETTVVIEAYGRMLKHTVQEGLAVQLGSVDTTMTTIGETSVMVVRHGLIRSVFLTDRPAWPVCQLVFDDDNIDGAVPHPGAQR